MKLMKVQAKLKKISLKFTNLLNMSNFSFVSDKKRLK